MGSRVFLTVLQVLALSPFISADDSSSTVLSISSASCSGEFELSDFSATCNGSSSCSYGSHVTISGTIVSDYGFTENPTVQLKTCKWGFCFDAYETSFNLCNQVTATNGETCPGAGTYTFSSETDVPNIGYSLSGVSFDLKAVLYSSSSSSSGSSSESSSSSSSGKSTTCSVSLNASSSSVYQDAMLGFAVAGIAVFGLAAMKHRNKKRRLAIDSSKKINLLPKSQEFEMATQGSVV
eukprot:CAMPEP_0202446214 /NCGR_PEP_ID=MMETSP1360-20130828/4793_1 /ASSEMBLY_ACC=CAM_ASM_000848 /TAXON_ID=515479 /ORGANISM="Licmophora paradoxa, Strain CCMP2313" /LENGTH=236 /DNA_ID=CAMNT_0049062657 /DNA_START=54 /DNA_END=764 /DNA_ORIENTATION=+